METFSFYCAWCDRDQTATDFNSGIYDTVFKIGETNNGLVGSRQIVVRCSNDDCRKITLVYELRRFGRNSNGYFYLLENESALECKRILPPANAKLIPSYVPAPLREDYNEACKIRDLSPKSAATLARRCLQGMIRDFCQINEATLYKEISKLRAAVDAGSAPPGVSLESVDAIDHVRGVGNIGAHMEKDINNIVDVSPDEAQVLIELVESLFDEWYVAREKRRLRFEAVKIVAEVKKDVIAGFASKPALPKP